MKKRNPYRVATDIINRFRGLWAEAGRSNIGKEYTPVGNNLTSHKIGQLDSREGQDFDASFSDGIQDADRLVTARYVATGQDLFIEAIDPVTFFGIKTFNPPTSWNPPPWNPPPPPEVTCQDLWDYLGTPVEDQKTDGEYPDCFDIAITCEELWALLSTPPEYQKDGGSYPDCFEAPALTCEDLWETNNTPLEYRKAGGTYPSDCFIIPPPPPTEPKTCAGLWALAPTLAAYEVAAESETEIVEGNTGPCWSLTCADLWTVYPSFSPYEIAANSAYEMIETGGPYTMTSCWDQVTLNCEQMYGLYPQWDEFRKEGAVYPSCWNFYEEPPRPTCEEYWVTANVDEDLRKANGVFPDCITIPPFVPPPKDSCKSRLFSFPTYSDKITWNLEEGYTADSTTTPYDFVIDAHMHKSEIAQALDFEIKGVGGETNFQPEGNSYYQYLNVAAPCRRYVNYGQDFQVVAGLTEGQHTAVVTFLMSFNGYKNLPFVVELEANVTAYPWEALYNAYNTRRMILNDVFNVISPLPAYSSYDFSDYDTQISFLAEVQTFCEDALAPSPSTIYWRSTFVESVEYSNLITTTATDNLLTWVNAKATASMPLGFRRDVAGDQHGTVQSGDVVGQFMFDDINSMFVQYKYIVRYVYYADPSTASEPRGMPQYGITATDQGALRATAHHTVKTYPNDPPRDQDFTNRHWGLRSRRFDSGSGPNESILIVTSLGTVEMQSSPTIPFTHNGIYLLSTMWGNYSSTPKNWSIDSAAPASGSNLIRRITGSASWSAGSANLLTTGERPSGDFQVQPVVALDYSDFATDVL